MSQLVIMAGGKGTRLQTVLEGRPKPMVSILGKPLLEYQVELARKYNFKEILMLVDFGSEHIKEHFRDGNQFGISISYLQDKKPLGTAGAIIQAMEKLYDEFLVMYGDTLLDVDLNRFLEWHKSKNADVSLFVHPNDHPYDSDLVELDTHERVVAIHSYPHSRKKSYSNLVNAALYVMDKKVLYQFQDIMKPMDIAKDLFPVMLNNKVQLFGYKSGEYIKDVGTPERLDTVEKDLETGRVTASRHSTPKPAVFLDRDGTLNIDVKWLSDPKELRLHEGVVEAVRELNRQGLLAIIVTNQPVIARGDCSEEDLKNIHNKLETLFGRGGAYFNDIYYCPHHPDKGFPGEIPDLKIKCDCRKPATGLIDRACEDHNIDLVRSCVIGDSDVDIGLANNAGIMSILVLTGDPQKQKHLINKADLIFHDLKSAVNFIIHKQTDVELTARDLVNNIRPGQRILIGGPAKTGKTTLAFFCGRELSRRGLEVKTIHLDSWIKSASYRDESSIMGRFDVEGIDEFVRFCLSLNGVGSFNLPQYDRQTRSNSPDGEEVIIDPETVIIFEGVIGFMVDSLIGNCQHRFFINLPRESRREMFYKDYLWRGFSESDIEDLFEEREREEVRKILKTKKDATHIIEGKLLL